MTQMVRALPPELPAALFVVLHISEHGTSVLPEILARAGKREARHPEDGEAIRNNVIYVAPSNHHLMIVDGHVHIMRGPRENGHRPAVDPLFRSAARACGRRVIGIVLSGLLDDGTAGLLAIKRFGGTAIVQSPDEALFTGMIQSAIDNVEVDHVLPVAEIAALLGRLTREPLSRLQTNGPGDKEGNEGMAADIDAEIEAAEMTQRILDSSEHTGEPSAFSCPECGGVLWEIHDGDLVRFRCRTGHAYSSDTLLAEQTDALDAALWTALRALEESASLARRLRDRAAERGHKLAMTRFADQAEEAVERAAIIRRALLRPDPVRDGPEPPVD